MAIINQPGTLRHGHYTERPCPLCGGSHDLTGICPECGREEVACLECPDVYDGRPCERCATCSACRNAHLATCFYRRCDPRVTDGRSDR